MIPINCKGSIKITKTSLLLAFFMNTLMTEPFYFIFRFGAITKVMTYTLQDVTKALYQPFTRWKTAIDTVKTKPS